MNKTIALIDSNNFYTSCEQSMDPGLEGKPVVVLSNNDGCIVARNPEARVLGLSMGAPYFKIKNFLIRNNVKVLSSNYILYGDMSRRLMNILKDNCEEIEIYSIDEAFLTIRRPLNGNLKRWSIQLRQNIRKSLGLGISIGIGKTKVQAKIANYIAKNDGIYSGIFDLEEEEENIDLYLKNIEIENIWGIGKKSSKKLRMLGIKNAHQFRNISTQLVRSKFGLQLLKLQYELKGEKCIPINLVAKEKKEICISRSFNRPINNKNHLIKIISNQIIQIGERLRREGQITSSITIFTRTSLYDKCYYSKSATEILLVPTNNTYALLKSSANLIDQIFKPSTPLIKSGVIAKKLQRPDSIQQNLFEDINIKKQREDETLMKTIDYINLRYGKGTLRWSDNHRMHKHYTSSSKKSSNKSTTCLNEIPLVKA